MTISSYISILILNIMIQNLILNDGFKYHDFKSKLINCFNYLCVIHGIKGCILLYTSINAQMDSICGLKCTQSKIFLQVLQFVVFIVFFVAWIAMRALFWNVQKWMNKVPIYRVPSKILSTPLNSLLPHRHLQSWTWCLTLERWLCGTWRHPFLLLYKSQRYRSYHKEVKDIRKK